MKTKQTERGLCEHTDGQRAQTKMFIIAHYQRHANQSYREISSHTSQNGIIYQKVYKSYRLKRVWGKGSPTHRGWECTLVQPLWKTAWRFLRTKNRAAVPPSNRTAGCQTHAPLWAQKHALQQQSLRHNSDAHQQTNR